MNPAQEQTTSPQSRQDGPEQGPLPAAAPLNLYASEPFPYPRSTYVGRVLWGIVWCTIWQLCWVRIPILRTTILRLFGARIGGLVLARGSLRIQMPWALS